jgi:S1-C subfamily serine protease
MTRPVVYLFVSLAVIFCGLTLAKSTSAFESELENLSFTVAYLQEGEPPSQIGTGFFVGSKRHFYLVTAAHVAHFISRKSLFTVRNPGDVPLTLPFGYIVPGKTLLPLPWHFHPEADLAVLQLVNVEVRFFDKRFLPLNDSLEADEAVPQRERPLMVIGFPLALGTTGRFSPITVETKAASGLLRLKRPDTKTEATFFVLDKPSIGGYSGAPVFLMPYAYSGGPWMAMPSVGSPEARPKCVGVVSGTISDDTGGKLAAIVPSVFVVRMIKEIEEQELSRN